MPTLSTATSAPLPTSIIAIASSPLRPLFPLRPLTQRAAARQSKIIAQDGRQRELWLRRHWADHSPNHNPTCRRLLLIIIIRYRIIQHSSLYLGRLRLRRRRRLALSLRLSCIGLYDLSAWR